MKRLIGLMMAAVLLGACTPKPNDSEQVKTRSGADSSRSRQVEGQSVAGLSLKGLIWENSIYQEDFNEDVRSMLEMVIDREYVGYVSAQAQDETGVFVGGSIKLEGGKNPRSANVSAYAVIGSKLVLAVFDRFDGETPPAIGLEFKLIDGYVSGNYADLTFQHVGDNGTTRNYIRMAGNFDGEYFRPNVEYDVQETVSGGSGQTGPLGKLEVRTCDLFYCK